MKDVKDHQLHIICNCVTVMELHADLHAHSAFAGGARSGGKTDAQKNKRLVKRFEDAALYSPLKGVNIIGTGDIQYKPWMSFIQDNLEEVSNGIFVYNSGSKHSKEKTILDNNPPKYVLQSEVIITGPSPNGGKKRVHVVLLFPDFARVNEFITLMDKWQVAHENMARPFIVCSTAEEVSQKIHQIFDLDKMVEVIPAHVLTPEGVYGGNDGVNFMIDFFGSVSERFSAIETGLSADPDILGLIPELDRFTLTSNADAHSAKLNRVGREFTTYSVNQATYTDLIEAIRKNHVLKTAEFHPTEGRYFLTGHRADRKRPGVHKKKQYCYYSPKFIPVDNLCPICDKELTKGVLQRAFEIGIAQGEERNIGEGPSRSFVTMVPLVEIIAYSLGIKSISSKKVLSEYFKIIETTKNEVNIWNVGNSEFKKEILLPLEVKGISPEILDNISQVKFGNFSFVPTGYDGIYGNLQIGESTNYLNLKHINR